MTTAINTQPTAQPNTAFEPTIPTLNLPRRSLGQTLRNALVVTRREMRDSFRDWRIMGPIFLLTLVFPTLANNATRLFEQFFVDNGAAPLVDSFLPLMPMIIGFFPVSIALVIALETFVGEKERKSIEPLLSTPLSNTELYIGKTFAAMIPPLLASYLGIGLYVGGLVFGQQQWRPEPMLIIQILCLTTAQALVMVTGAVVVSSQTTSTRASNLLASFIVIPMSLLVMLESFIMITNNRYVLWYIVAGLVVVDLLLFSMGARIFNREELLGRSFDEINLKWFFRSLWQHIRGDERVKNLADWYRYSVFPSVGNMRGSAVIVTISIIGTFLLGYGVAATRTDLQLPMIGGTQYQEGLDNFRSLYELGRNSGVEVAIFTQNVRVLLVSIILATFTFGVMSTIFAALPFGIIGFMLGQPVVQALGVGNFFWGIVPHGIVEIPAIILCTAAAVRFGAIITRPPEGLGVWEAWTLGLGELIKIFIGLVIPMLIISAIIEARITPLIVLQVLGK